MANSRPVFRKGGFLRGMEDNRGEEEVESDDEYSKSNTPSSVELADGASNKAEGVAETARQQVNAFDLGRLGRIGVKSALNDE